MSPAHLIFARNLEKNVALTETSTTGHKEIDKEKNKTVHPTRLSPSLFIELVSPSPAPFDIRTRDPVDISRNNRKSPIAKK